jgi:hypothetical protein
MGKRIKWFNDTEADQIREGKLDYSTFFSPIHLQSAESEKLITKENLIQAYRQLEATRL